MNPIVSLEDVSLRYHSIGGETSAVSHLSLSVQAGEFISIVGPSGCGKSTILSMLAGQLAPSEGSIYIGGTIGYMLQKDYLLQGGASVPMPCSAWKSRKADPRKHRLC